MSHNSCIYAPLHPVPMNGYLCHSQHGSELYSPIHCCAREIDGLGTKSKLAHHIMLVNFGVVKTKKTSHQFVTQPTQVILPLSPNHGLFGNDGLYSESKIWFKMLPEFWELGQILMPGWCCHWVSKYHWLEFKSWLRYFFQVDWPHESHQLPFWHVPLSYRQPHFCRYKHPPRNLFLGAKWPLDSLFFVLQHLCRKCWLLFDVHKQYAGVPFTWTTKMYLRCTKCQQLHSSVIWTYVVSFGHMVPNLVLMSHSHRSFVNHNYSNDGLH